MMNGEVPRLLLWIQLLFCAILLSGVQPSFGSSTFVVVEPAVFSSDNYPCSGCHQKRDTDPRPRQLRNHLEIVLTDHAGDKRWCLDCHDADNRDRLLLGTGEKVEFTASHRICRQCHASIHNVWQLGLHGKRTGNWDGQPRYTLCSSCHDPHDPGFKPFSPEPPPVPPEQTLRRPR